MAERAVRGGSVVSTGYKRNLRDNLKPPIKEPLYLKMLKRRVVRKGQAVKDSGVELGFTYERGEGIL